MKIKLVVLSLLIGAGGAFGVGTAAQAGCNFHGCSQVPGVECNFHGCPIPPNGGECNFHGCPPPTQQRTTQQSKIIYQQRVNPADIATCMNKLMFTTNEFGRWRTQISEQAAIQACTGGR